jgi:hypothetical protein
VQICRIYWDWETILLKKLVKLFIEIYDMKIDLELTPAEKALLKEKKVTQKSLRLCDG